MRAPGIAAGIVRAALADFPVRVHGGFPGVLWDLGQCGLLPPAQLPAHGVDHLVTGAGRQLVQLPDQGVAGAGPVAGDHQLPAERRRQRGDRLAQDLQVISGGIRPGRAGAQHPRQRLPHVVAFGDQRVMAEALEIRLGQLLIRVRGHHGRVQPDARHPLQRLVRDPHRRQRAGLRPRVPPRLVHRSRDLALRPVPGAGDLLQRPPRRRHRRHQAEQLPLIAHHPEITDHPGAVRDRARQVADDPAPVMTPQRRRQRP